MLYTTNMYTQKRKAKENSLISSPGVARLTGHNIMNDKPHRMDSFRLEGSVYIHNKMHVCTLHRLDRVDEKILHFLRNERQFFFFFGFYIRGSR